MVLLKTPLTIFQIATGVCRVQALCLPVDGRPQGSRPTNTCGNLKKVSFFIIINELTLISGTRNDAGGWVILNQWYKLRMGRGREIFYLTAVFMPLSALVHLFEAILMCRLLMVFWIKKMNPKKNC